VMWLVSQEADTQVQLQESSSVCGSLCWAGTAFDWRETMMMVGILLVLQLIYSNASISIC